MSYWLTIVQMAKQPELLESAIKNIEEIRGEYSLLATPWLPRPKAAAETIGDAVSDFREEFGEPGDPRYERMLEYNDALFKRLGESATRRQRRQAREAAHVPTTS